MREKDAFIDDLKQQISEKIKKVNIEYPPGVIRRTAPSNKAKGSVVEMYTSEQTYHNKLIELIEYCFDHPNVFGHDIVYDLKTIILQQTALLQIAQRASNDRNPDALNTLFKVFIKTFSGNKMLKNLYIKYSNKDIIINKIKKNLPKNQRMEAQSLATVILQRLPRYRMLLDAIGKAGYKWFPLWKQTNSIMTEFLADVNNQLRGINNFLTV
ncbi:hypothetical protein EIN_234820 [Entamoeba invadens IP1]|uniref:DH domain-containing protein n=1 Tax=Entamoeba invadens IP1 TaxID=370355 RepID=L7FK89_ENTIV|nr:hypothetical protein EIN_234820 [Entamoeba invadens IP1]ELP86015.1 hypothetical protein EIN_234820 [Entamoeba invadens IP1]|eukprot:XP_004185361.1 hypothetical protein EIN_234820 [Entamoeba invadens IP1]